jgi:ubiquinone/menaquinone biosynthesis C-methylase UbiE
VTSANPYKQAAIEQWTADPCGSDRAEGEPGSREYFLRLIEERRLYAPWLDEALAYEEAANLDVLDVGCGQGIDVARYAIAGARARGLDLTPRHVELAREHLAALRLDAEIVLGDAEALPFSDASFDRVSSNGVLHHTPNMPVALAEIRRVLRPGGETRIVVYNRSSLHYWVNQFLLDGILNRGLLRERSMAGVLSSGVEHSTVGARPLVRVYSPRQLRSLLEEARFTSVQTSVYHFHAGDTFVTDRLSSHMRFLKNQNVLDRFGRKVGWYVVGTGRADDARPKT